MAKSSFAGRLIAIERRGMQETAGRSLFEGGRGLRQTELLTVLQVLASLEEVTAVSNV